MSEHQPPHPHPKGMPSFWRSTPGVLDNHRSIENLPTTADIVIIGAGYSGASIVTQLLRHPSYSVIPATPSRSHRFLSLNLNNSAQGPPDAMVCGHLKPDSYAFIAKLAQEYGLKAAAEVADFESANAAAVTEFIRQEKIDCDFVVTRAIDVQLSEGQHRRLREGYENLVEAGVQSTRATFCAPEQYAERLSGVKGAKGMFSYTAGHVWPYKLIHHLFADAIGQGVNVQTNTSATSISRRQKQGEAWVIETPRGKVHAKQVIMATNTYTGSLLPEYADKIIPYRGAVAHIKTPGTAPFPPNTYSLRFADWDFDYLIPRSDGSIIVGGARQAYLGDKKQWYANVDDGHVIEETRKYFDGYMQRHFIGWEDSEAYVADLWTGIMGYSSDRLPRVGPIPKRQGMYIMAGFTGHGMPQVFLCAKGIADMVLDGASFGNSGLPSLFEETQTRLSDPRNMVKEIYNSAFPQAKL
ncbi:FAD dependent oxidoreductase [Fusarium keratoplasticum]|nr:FAD dependent oxidoreductase [Fusarium keratoplasticum]